MTRGGKRDRSGRKSTWASGCKFEDTKLIRVPAAIADQLLELAHKLDAGEILQLAKPPRRLSPNTDFGVACPECKSIHLRKDGFQKGEQRFACKECGRKFLNHLGIGISDLETNSNNLVTKSNSPLEFQVSTLSDQVNPLPEGSEQSGEG